MINKNYTVYQTLKIVIPYTIISVLYIYFSDELLDETVRNVDTLTTIQTYKGLGFVAISAALLYLLVIRHLKDNAKTSKALLEQERTYRAMLENNNDIIVRVDEQGGVQFCSNNLLESTGFTSADLNSIHLEKLVFPDDVYTLSQCWANALSAPQKLFNAEFRIVKSTGELMWMECSMVNHLSDPHINGVIINARNIDNRKNAETALRKSEEKYATLFNSSPLPVWIYDINTLKFVDVNEAAVIHYGYSRAEFLEMTLKGIRPQEEHGKMLDAVLRAKNLLHNDNKEVYKHIKKDGTIISVRIESIAIALDDNKYRMALAIDLTEHLKQQQELIDSANKLSLAQDIANLGYWSQDTKTDNMYWSDLTYTLFDQDPATFTPSVASIVAMVPIEDQILFSPKYEQEHLNNGIFDIEHRITTPKGNKKWLFCRIKVTVENGEVVKREGVAIDITKRKQDEEAILRKSNLLLALNKFTGSLLSNENWITIFDKSMEIVAQALQLDKIFYVENDIDPNTGEQFAYLKQLWTMNPPPETSLHPPLQKTSFANNMEIINRLKQGTAFEAKIDQIPDGEFKNAIRIRGAKTVYLQPVILRGNFHGVFGFIDSREERILTDDEKIFVASLVSNICTKIEKDNVEDEVKITRERLASVITNLPGITIRRRAIGNWAVIYVNDEVERLTGYHASDFVNNAVRSFESLIHPADRDKKINTIRNIQPGASFSIEFRLICKNGNVIWLRGNGRAIAGHDGKVAYIDEVLVDVTETYKKKQELIASNERFRTVMKAAAEAIIDWDIVNDTVVWGDGFKEFFGYDLSVYDGKLWSRNIHPEDREWVLDLMDATLADPTKESFYAEFRFLKANREVAYVQNRCTFIRDEHGKAIRGIGALADVTESVERRKKIEKQNESLIEIAWIQSHVIRAPLATLLGLMTLFKAREEMELDEDDLVEKIMESAHSLDKVIHEVVRKAEAVSNL